MSKPRAGGAGGLVASAPTCTLTCLYHQPLPGECAYTLITLSPGTSAFVETAADQPAAVQSGRPRARATSGRSWANRAFVSKAPPLPRLPRKISTSSMPAQPSAVRSTTQPASCSEPGDVMRLFVAGASIAPVNVLSPVAPAHAASRRQIGPRRGSKSSLQGRARRSRALHGVAFAHLTRAAGPPRAAGPTRPGSQMGPSHIPR